MTFVIWRHFRTSATWNVHTMYEFDMERLTALPRRLAWWFVRVNVLVWIKQREKKGLIEKFWTTEEVRKSFDILYGIAWGTCRLIWAKRYPMNKLSKHAVVRLLPFPGFELVQHSPYSLDLASNRSNCFKPVWPQMRSYQLWTIFFETAKEMTFLKLGSNPVRLEVTMLGPELINRPLYPKRRK